MKSYISLRNMHLFNLIKFVAVIFVLRFQV